MDLEQNVEQMIEMLNKIKLFNIASKTNENGDFLCETGALQNLWENIGKIMKTMHSQEK